MDLSQFKQDDFLSALKTLFNDLNVPINYVADDPIDAKEILKDTHKDNDSFKLIDDVYFLGMVDDAAFDQNPSLAPEKIKSDYDGILIFGVTLQERENGLLPTRSQLAEISRAFNREYYYTPVIVVFKYENNLAFANTERLKYKQEWREGEKAGKVTLLRDIDISNPHAGHQRIINQLRISTTGTSKVDSFASLYEYWQSVFSVSLLNKKFYEELSNWYFWAIKEVRFPSEPDVEIGQNINTNRQEHNAKNVIRLLTRFLFVWFIKEKKLIPEELFQIEFIENDLLKEVSPYRGDNFLTNQKSYYYKAVLQNLFFATLNQEMGKREFRKENRQHRNITNLLRYNSYFKNPKQFIELVEATVPFMNGGLFECLDKPHPFLKGRQGGEVIIYEDGFSDRADNELIVPDYLFFGTDEEIDLSAEYGSKSKKYKQAAVKGLINIFESYKFTIAENTSIEEDVALDPELLGKVFENLLASYNPETKTTARKQTGSFYTPREIVTYMVDESLIAYLKGAVKNWGGIEKIDKKLHALLSFDPINPFDNNDELQIQIIKALDQCTILDPACGSGAFPMGILQKMTHLLDKLDPRNEKWKQRQIDRVKEAIQAVEKIDDVSFRDNAKKELKGQIQDIEEAFNSNELDYGRKLYLIENCLYGLDIQPIAVQISKLRFFISLVVDQTVDKSKDNFAIRPLPNLETKFVAANSLIGIDKSEYSGELFANPKILGLEKELQVIRHRVFSAKTPKTKSKLHNEDQELRDKMGELLIADGWNNTTATQLASWNPYDQNASSPFFDAEWMFGIKNGFDIVIGNPPYLKERDNAHFFEPVNKSSFGDKWHQGKMDFWFYFLHLAIDLSKSEICFITSRYWLNSQGASKLIKRISNELYFVNILDIGKLKVFDAVAGHHMVSHLSKKKQEEFNYIKLSKDVSEIKYGFSSEKVELNALRNSKVFTENDEIVLSKDYFSEIEEVKTLGELFHVSQGVVEAPDKISKKQFKNSTRVDVYEGQGVFVLTKKEVEELNLNTKARSLLKLYVDPNNISNYYLDSSNLKYLIYSDKIIKEEIDTNIELLKIKNHLDLLSEFITSSNKPYGIHRARNQEYFERPKIIFKNMFLNPEFAYDDTKIYFGFSFSSIIKKNKDYSLKYLLTLLNSSFAKKWFYTFGKKRGVGVDIGVQKLRMFPVRLIARDSQEIFIMLSDIAVYARPFSDAAFKTVSNIIDGLVFQLYFSNHMLEEKIDIEKFIKQDLEDSFQENTFINLSNIEKENIINQLHANWSHPDNEVRNRIKLFAVRSPDILKPILESQP